MAKLVVGMVFLTDYEKADNIISKIQQQFNIELLHVETSYSKLRITKDLPKEG